MSKKAALAENRHERQAITLETLGLQLVQHELVKRRELQGMLGLTFGGDRDMYAALGYPSTIRFKQYLARYKRQDIAGRIVDAPANETWRSPPTILDGEDEEAEFSKQFAELAHKARLWHYFQRLDRISGIGRYGVMLLGLKGQANLELPAEKVSGGIEDLIYLTVLDEDSASIEKLDEDPSSPRFGLPEVYKLDLGETTEGRALKKDVHHSRVIHVAENVLESEIYGAPRMERVYNRLIDLEKVVGGGSEATWKLAYKGIVLTTQDDYVLPEAGSDEFEERKDEIEEFVHGMKRVLDLEGSDARFEGGENIDPSGMFETLIGLISGEREMPQRILLGSERGDLASTQDASSWAGVIEGRRANFAEPVIIGQFIDSCVDLGVLDKWKDEQGWTARWEPLFELTALEEADLANKVSEAISRLTPLGSVSEVLDVAKFIETYLPKLSDAQAVIDQEDILQDEEDEIQDEEIQEVEDEGESDE